MGIVQEIEIWPFEQMVYAQPNISPGEWDIHTDHLISDRRPDLIIINKKREVAEIVDFTVLANHKVKLKESEKKDKY